MKLATLFWFYKEPEICLNKLKLVRKFNPGIKIFGLFGGNKKEAGKYVSKFGDYLDDFYISNLCDKPKDYKWLHGDLMVEDWYQKRGKKLAGWDSAAIVQWDTLVLGEIKKQLLGIKKGELFISGTRQLEPFIERRWSWTKKKGTERQNYLKFKKYIRKNYNYRQTLLCSLFVFAVIPREFFEKWSTVENKEIGMLEYKLPTYAKIFKIPIYRRDLGIWWFDSQLPRGKTPMNAKGFEISKKLILAELKKRNGFRIFYPYSKIW